MGPDRVQFHAKTLHLGWYSGELRLDSLRDLELFAERLGQVGLRGSPSASASRLRRPSTGMSARPSIQELGAARAALGLLHEAVDLGGDLLVGQVGGSIALRIRDSRSRTASTSLRSRAPGRRAETPAPSPAISERNAAPRCRTVGDFLVEQDPARGDGVKDRGEGE